MMKNLFVFVLCFLFVLFSGCSSDDKKEDEKDLPDFETTDENDSSTDEDGGEIIDDELSDDTEESDEQSDVEEEEIIITCADVVEGMNKGIVSGEGDDELLRDFIIRFPENLDSKEKWPVVFLFHGYGDSAVAFESYLKGEVNNETMPFILVTPVPRDDIFTFGIPPKGLDWDMIDLSDGSAEVDFFDLLLECIDTRWGVDEERIYLSGFSAGAITSDSIALMRSEKIASVFTYSGAYFSNPDARDALGEIMGMTVGDFFSWPDFEEGHNKYTQVLISGEAEKDTWSTNGFKIDFNQMAGLDSEYLTELGHNIVLCNHGGGHSMSGLSKKDAVKFFFDHPLGTEVSPYKDGLPEGWDDVCQYMESNQE
jgi:predicted esterase